MIETRDKLRGRYTKWHPISPEMAKKKARLLLAGKNPQTENIGALWDEYFRVRFTLEELEQTCTKT